MLELTPKILTILQKYMCDTAAPVGNSTTLRELEIDMLDLPMILLDAEEVFDVTIRCGDELDDPVTVGGLIACVAARLEAKASQSLRPLRPKRNWMSVGAERRR
jgi:acyl carrier protein